MATRMLIDARHPEETRVAVLKGNRIEEFDFESAEHKQIKGNIYLAKVTRVEPSLQAAFVEFGGNRHGFLAFGEIHPDYYQIPKEDREALLAEEAEAAAEEAALRAAEEEEDDAAIEDGNGSESFADEMAGENIEEVDTDGDDVATIEGGHVEDGDDGDDDGEDDGDRHDDEAAHEDSDEARDGESDDEGRPPRRGQRRGRGRRQGGRPQAKQADELRAKRMELRRRYKIQDVIQRRQVLLVQVVKEERGNKGAALTTYLSLAGRYCVLMPNSSHGGGISRKISNAGDRKRLKQIVGELTLPKSMGCIVRTAGLQRTKPEIKRDFDYLARLWDEIRENTLSSSAPNLIHSDSDLVKRAIRDIYDKEIEEVVVEGEEGYKAAKQFMKLLMPSHAKRVKQYADPVPLFQRYGAEDQLSAMYDPVVQLKSGGYLVINPTEALVSIDINSGRSTKEHGIEQTALATNLEAAREIARQLRLRDMAGLVVIDFIDMEYSNNVRKVERAMKDALKHDRARIQLGRISSFGLMEMSRQRLRTGVLEATTRSCPHCDGTGLVRTASSAGLSALRLIEDEAAKGRGSVITLYASTEATIYLLNAKRSDLATIEQLYGVTVQVIPEGEDEGAKMRVTSGGPRPTSTPRFEPIVEEIEDDVEDEVEDEDDDEDDDRDEGRESRDRDRQGRGGRSRRRGGRNRKRPDGERGHDPERARVTAHEDDDADEDGEPRARRETEDRDENGEERPKKRRRRGGRRRRRGRGDGEGGEAHERGEDGSEADEQDASEAEAPAEEAPVETEAKPKRRSRKKPAQAEDEVAEPAEEPAAEPEAPAEAEAEAEEPKPKRRSRKKADAEAVEQAPVEAEPEAVEKPKPRGRKKAAPAETVAKAASEPATAAEDSGPPRRGWWQRTFGEAGEE
jgi:ribonuclease E